LASTGPLPSPCRSRPGSALARSSTRARLPPVRLFPHVSNTVSGLRSSYRLILTARDEPPWNGQSPVDLVRGASRACSKTLLGVPKQPIRRMSRPYLARRGRHASRHLSLSRVNAIFAQHVSHDDREAAEDRHRWRGGAETALDAAVEREPRVEDTLVTSGRSGSRGCGGGASGNATADCGGVSGCATAWPVPSRSVVIRMPMRFMRVPEEGIEPSRGVNPTGF
jgi:hypothetical protein